MFEQVCIAADTSDTAALLDCLAYYGVVDLEIGSGGLAALCQTLGFDEVCDLIDADVLRLLYSEHVHVVQSDNTALPTYLFSAASFINDADGRSMSGTLNSIETALRRTLPSPKTATQLAQRLADRVVARPHYSDIDRLAREELRDDKFRNEAATIVLNNLVPGFLGRETLRVDFLDLGAGRFSAAIPIDYVAVNKEYHKGVSPAHSTVSTAFILANIYTSRRVFSLAAERSSDMVVPAAIEQLIDLRVRHLAQRFSQSRADRTYFEDVHFEGATIGSAVTSGMKSPREFVDFVLSENTRRMKTWSASLAPDARLVVEFANEVRGHGLLEKLPVKLTKYSLFTGVGTLLGNGLIGAGIGMTVDAIDEFWLSKLRLGWSPNSWVESARSFVRGSE